MTTADQADCDADFHVVDDSIVRQGKDVDGFNGLGWLEFTYCCVTVAAETRPRTSSATSVWTSGTLS